MELQKQIDEILEQVNVDLWSISSQGTGQSVKPAEYQIKKNEVLSKTRQKLCDIICDFLKTNNADKLRYVMTGIENTQKDERKEPEIDTNWPPDYVDGDKL